MARNYWTRCETSCADGDPFDAWTARTRIQTNLEAVYEEARNDQCIVLSSPVAFPTASTYWGPVPVLLRRDRDQHWRTPQISILVSHGSIASMEWRVVLMPSYYPPMDPPGIGAGDNNDYASWTVTTGGTTLSWRTATSITLSDGFGPVLERIPSGDEEGRFRLGWASVWIRDTPIVTFPQFAGIRFIETVDDEP